MKLRSLPLFLLLAALASAQPAAPRASKERLQKVAAFLDRYVAENRIPGAVALVLQDGKPVFEHATGWADKESGRRMQANTIFRIASQTKAFTSAAIMTLVEEGKVGLTEPVGRFIPSFNATTVKDEQGRIGPAKRQITIHDLLTHTAGISYGVDASVAAAYKDKQLGPAAGNGWYTADKNEPICETMERLGTLPFVAQPGEKYVYGYNTDILGCIAEKASGMTLDKLIESRITGPLGLKDTRFYLNDADVARFATVYANQGETAYVRAVDGPKGQGDYVKGPRRSFSGGAGLTSTAHDYARFLEMIRRGGDLDGVRVLSPRAARLMRTNQSGMLHSTDGLGFGYGFQTVDRYGAKGLAGVGAFGWGGAYGSTYLVDPESRLVVVYMMQLMPNSTDVQPKFLNTVFQALE